MAQSGLEPHIAVLDSIRPLWHRNGLSMQL